MTQMSVGILNRQGEILFEYPLAPSEPCDRQVARRRGTVDSGTVEAALDTQETAQPLDGGLRLEVAQLTGRLAVGDLRALGRLCDVTASRRVR